jgi:hypothetical protein
MNEQKYCSELLDDLKTEPLWKKDYATPTILSIRMVNDCINFLIENKDTTSSYAKEDLLKKANELKQKLSSEDIMDMYLDEINYEGYRELENIQMIHDRFINNINVEYVVLFEYITNKNINSTEYTKILTKYKNIFSKRSQNVTKLKKYEDFSLRTFSEMVSEKKNISTYIYENLRNFYEKFYAENILTKMCSKKNPFQGMFEISESTREKNNLRCQKNVQIFALEMRRKYLNFEPFLLSNLCDIIRFNSINNEEDINRYTNSNIIYNSYKLDENINKINLDGSIDIDEITKEIINLPENSNKITMKYFTIFLHYLIKPEKYYSHYENNNAFPKNTININDYIQHMINM